MYDKLNKDEDKTNSDDDSQAASAGGSPNPGGGGGKKDNDTNPLKTNKGDIKLSEHAKTQMSERGVSQDQVINTINKGEQFKYKDLQSGEIRTGYYDKTNNIFVGKGTNITTVIKPQGGQNYINNLKAR